MRRRRRQLERAWQRPELYHMRQRGDQQVRKTPCSNRESIYLFQVFLNEGLKVELAKWLNLNSAT